RPTKSPAELNWCCLGNGYRAVDRALACGSATKICGSQFDVDPTTPPVCPAARPMHRSTVGTRHLSCSPAGGESLEFHATARGTARLFSFDVGSARADVLIARVPPRL